MTDPSTVTHDFLDENLDSGCELHRLDTSVGPPRDPRWAGQKPPLSPARERAIAEKLEWQRRRAELGDIAECLPSLASVELVNPHELAIALGLGRTEDRDARVVLLALRLLARLAIMALSGIGACAVPLVELGQAVSASERHTRRALQWLVTRTLLEAVPTFERHGHASSRRATAYVVPTWVLDALGGIACTGARAVPILKRHPERIPTAGSVSLETDPSISSADAMPPRRRSSPALPAAGVVSASPTVDFSAAAPAAAADAPCPVAREGASCSAPPEAPDAGGRELAAAEEPPHVAAWRALAARGDTFAAELLRDHERREAFVARVSRVRMQRGGAS